MWEWITVRREGNGRERIGRHACMDVPMTAYVHVPMTVYVHVPMTASVHVPMTASVHVPMTAYGMIYYAYIRCA